MANTNKCSMCEKSPGIMHCRGCDGYFCGKHLRSHREFLSNEMETLIGKRDQVQDAVNHVVETTDSQNRILAQIEDWEKAVIAEVRELANRVRNQTKEILNEKCVQIDSELKKVTKEIIEMNDNESFTELDIARLDKMLDSLCQGLKCINESSMIMFHKERSDQIEWSTLVYIEEKMNQIQRQERVKTASTKKSQLAVPGTYKTLDQSHRLYMRSSIHNMANDCHCFHRDI